MEQTDYNKIAPLRVAARPGASLDEFNVYYQAFKNKTGIVKVKLSSRDMKLSPAHVKAIAEMKALQYLLAGIEILSEGRTGDSVVITATSKAIKEVMAISKLTKPIRDQLLNEAKTLKYIKGTNLPLACYFSMSRAMPSVIARFMGATIEISDNVKWINPVVPEKNIHVLAGAHRILHRIDVTGMGKIAVSAHAYERFEKRSKITDPEVLWKVFLETIRKPSVKLTPCTDAEKIKFHEELHGQAGRRYYDSENHWHFIVVDDEGEQVLVTCYYYEYKGQ